MENAQKKLDALRVAVDAMSSVLTVNPRAFEGYPDIFSTLADLRMDLIDVIDEERWTESYNDGPEDNLHYINER
jgi:FtsZ-interacting cell division protein YlmF